MGMNTLKQTHKLIEQMNAFQAELETLEVIGESGTGLVKVVMNCQNCVKSLKIATELIVPSDVEILEDLIVAALNDAKSKVEAKVEEQSRKLTAGLPNIPGVGLNF
jgi:DNA-binding YbaB/EbfC family protein